MQAGHFLSNTICVWLKSVHIWSSCVPLWPGSPRIQGEILPNIGRTRFGRTRPEFGRTRPKHVRHRGTFVEIPGPLGLEYSLFFAGNPEVAPNAAIASSPDTALGTIFRKRIQPHSFLLQRHRSEAKSTCVLDRGDLIGSGDPTGPGDSMGSSDMVWGGPMGCGDTMGYGGPVGGGGPTGSGETGGGGGLGGGPTGRGGRRGSSDPNGPQRLLWRTRRSK